MKMSNKSKSTRKIENDSDSDSDISLDGENNESSVDVGFIDDENTEELTSDDLKLDRILLRSPFFASKIGGKPAWLCYRNLPLAVGAGAITEINNNDKPIHLKCEKCEAQLIFLLQIYAPINRNDKFFNQIENAENTFHRILYVFLCANTECTNARTFKVLRSQLNRKNEFYNFEAPPEMTDTDADLKLSSGHLHKFYKNLYEKNMLNTCSVCGFGCTNKCSKCSFSFFCSRNHQVFDWTQMNHKSLCAKYSSSLNNVDELIQNWIDDENSNEKYPSKREDEKNKNLIQFFPEHEILIEPEELEFVKQKQKNDAKSKNI
jgi:pre-rRNA-processing protein TSR4